MNNIYTDKQVINIINDAHPIEMVIEKKQTLVINCFFDKVQDMLIDIKQTDDSFLIINYAGYVQDNTNVNIKINLTGNNNKTIVKVRTIEEANHANFEVTVKASEKTVGNEITEDLKAINEGGTITFMPILEVDTHDVKAEHYATIGGFDSKELFYLESKMLSIKTAKELLKKKFMLCLFSDSFIGMLNEGKEFDE